MYISLQDMTRRFFKNERTIDEQAPDLKNPLLVHYIAGGFRGK
jgi:hypothetical protein